MDASTVLFYVIAGTVVGLLGKFLAPGSKDNIPMWLALVCGLGGMLVGDVIHRLFISDGSDGLGWVQGLIAVLTAVVLVAAASALMAWSRRRRARRS